MPGKIIVIEGTDCSGKETQSKLLEQRLIDDNIKCKRFEFPMYDTPTGKIIGGDYLGKPEIGKSLFTEGAVNVDPHVVSLYYAADRKYNMNKIKKYLDEGYYIILDRYTTSNLAHQGSKIKDKDERFNMYQWIDKLEYWLLELPKPDKTIFLHMPLEYTKELQKGRANLDEHEKDYNYLKQSEEAYLELTELYNWTKIECVKDNEIRTIEDINNEIYEKIKND
ncbi:MAG: thymidylate kinase [Bacilli bacterium]|nr:thymidylate kinase [Bacilli bacterium]